MPFLCGYSAINAPYDGGPETPYDGCEGLIDIHLSSDKTSFTWSARNGQLVDAVIGTADSPEVKYTYDPAVTRDDDPITSTTGQAFDNIYFCGTLGAYADAGAGGNDASPPPPHDDDAGSNGKAW